MKLKITLLFAAALITGCGSVSNSIPTVKIEKRKPKTTAVQTTTVQQASYIIEDSTVSASPAQAAMMCESADMRNKVIDSDNNNDTVRMMVVHDDNTGSRLLSEVEVDCRDYFLRKSLSPTDAKVIRTSSPKVETIEAPIRRRLRNNNRYTYIVQRGDTVWNIAREHCTSAKAISRLNGLGRGNIIDIGQRLKLPDVDCD